MNHLPRRSFPAIGKVLVAQRDIFSEDPDLGFTDLVRLWHRELEGNYRAFAWLRAAGYLTTTAGVRVVSGDLSMSCAVCRSVNHCKRVLLSV